MALHMQFPGLPANARAINYETLTVSNTPKALTTAEYLTSITKDGGNANKAFEQVYLQTHAKAAWVTVEAQPLRVTLDGTTVDASTGHKLVDGDSLVVCGHDNIVRARFHRQGGVDSTIHVTYFTW